MCKFCYTEVIVRVRFNFLNFVCQRKAVIEGMRTGEKKQLT